LTSIQDLPDRPAPADGGGAWAHNARIGLVLFFVYLVFFAGFIALAAFGKDVMASHLALVSSGEVAEPCFGGVNVAIIYGFFLIIAAFVLAMLYMVLCQPEPLAPEVPLLTEVQVSELAQTEEGSA
jgi:uncharacterized membrane protein (DUF485 family)